MFYCSIALLLNSENKKQYSNIAIKQYYIPMPYDLKYFNEVYDRSREAAIISQKRAMLLLETFPLVRRVLDVGCGFGDVLEFLEMQGIEVSGVDISQYALERAREKISGELHQLDVASQPLPFSDTSFDAVTLFDLVEHLSAPDQLFAEVYRVLQPGGLVFITTLNHQGWLRAVLTRVFPDDPTHVNVQKDRYWSQHLEKAGFGEVKVKGVILHGFPPLPALRRWLGSAGFPVFRGPVFFPLTQLCGTLYVLARKPGSNLPTTTTLEISF